MYWNEERVYQRLHSQAFNLAHTRRRRARLALRLSKEMTWAYKHYPRSIDSIVILGRELGLDRLRITSQQHPERATQATQALTRVFG